MKSKRAHEKDKEVYLANVEAELKTMDKNFMVSNWHDIIHLFNTGVDYKKAAKTIYGIYS